MDNIPTHMGMTEPQRKRGLNSLLAYTFLMVAGYSMLMPLVAVHFVNNVGLTSALVGTALAVRQITQQGLTVFGGLLSDHLGAKRMICAGVLVRALGFASLAWAAEPLWLFVAMILSALGGALFEAPYQATIVALTKEEERKHYYLVSNWTSGVAATVGPLIGIGLLQFDFASVCYGAAACFLINYLVSLFLLPNVGQADDSDEEDDSKTAFGKLALVWRNRPFVRFTALMTGYWFVSVQFYLTFPLQLVQLSGNQESVGVMYALGAAMTVALQYHLVKWFELKFDTRQILVLGVLIMAIGCGAVALAHEFYSFMACAMIFTFGVLLTRPTQQTIIAQLADKRALGSYMGFGYLALAIGGGIGNGFGGWLLDVAKSNQLNALPWLVFAVVGVVSAIGIYRLTGGRDDRCTNLFNKEQKEHLHD
jgi:DHA1 family multidrug resistance protein-like MFS transporter